LTRKFATCLCLLLCAVVQIAGCARSASTTEPNVNALPIENAINVGYDAARIWRNNAQLQYVMSQDTDLDLAARRPPGLDGRRRAWALQFKDPQTHEFIVIQILDGKVQDIDEAGTDERPGVDLGKVNLSGVTIAEKARKMNLLPGKGWAVGYHFILAWDSQFGHYIEVLGLTAQGKEAHLLFDPKTGLVLSSLG
jgi:hypothetical protein